MNSLLYVLSLKVHSDDLWAKGSGKRKSCRVGIDCVDFRCALEKSPFNTANLYNRSMRHEYLSPKQKEEEREPVTRLKLTPIGPKPQIPTISPFWTPVSTTAWYEVGRTSERSVQTSISVRSPERTSPHLTPHRSSARPVNLPPHYRHLLARYTKTYTELAHLKKMEK